MIRHISLSLFFLLFSFALRKIKTKILLERLYGDISVSFVKKKSVLIMACDRKSFTTKWRIEKFCSWLQKHENILYGPKFTIETMDRTTWRLVIYLQDEPTLKYIVLSLLREEDGGPELVELNYELSFLANDESPLQLEKFSGKFDKTNNCHELKVKLETILVDKRPFYLPQENLTVCCQIWRNRSPLDKIGLCFIRTVIGVERLMLNGILENCSSLNSFRYRTINFISPSTGKSLVSLYVQLDYHNSKRIKFENIPFRNNFIFIGKLFILDDVGNKRECEKRNSSFYEPLSYANCSFYLDFIIEELIATNFLQNDILTLQCEVLLCPGIELENVEYEFPEIDSILEDFNVCNSQEHEDITNNIHEDKQSDSEEQSQLMTSFKSDMSALYNDQLFTDTLLQTGTITFPAHRNVLSARSPVFRKMFSTDMKETAGETINITDLSPDTVRRMLVFIYTDTIDGLNWETVKEVYFASDKYEILSLKHRCSLFMKQNLTASNVGEILILADRHQDDDLKEAVQEYILKHDQDVFGSDEWKEFMETHCHLAANIMYICLKK